jgi:diguanylate cyclase (GGDEF)-like protein
MRLHANSPARVDHAHGDGRLPDLTSGVMWLSTALFALIAVALPGSARTHLAWALALAAFAMAWGGFSVWLGVTGRTMSIELRALVTALMMPVVGAALWATGGVNSFIQPVLLLTILFVAYFFPPGLAWPLVVLFVAAYASPFLYDHAAVHNGYPGRVLMFAVAVTCATSAMGILKRRLLRAEAHQRAMAERDALTGVHNRRSFDRGLAAALERASESSNVALVVFDFNDFKLINDEHGHPVGDAVLSAVADACYAVVREGDCLARIGGDEFALIAPGAGEEGVHRVVAALDQVIARAQMPPGVGSVRATFGWAVAPRDGHGAGELFRTADERLLERKRVRRAPGRDLRVAAPVS